MRRLVDAALAGVLLACALVALVLPFWYWDGGLLEIEGAQFLRQFVESRRGILQTVFDPHMNDLGTFQARELSFLFGYLDARIFGLLMAADRPLFVPASALLASVLAIAIVAGAAYRQLRPVQLVAALALLVYLTNYVHLVTMGMHYRPTKVLLAPVLMGATFYMIRVMRGAGGVAAPYLLFALFCAMSLLDRQGFFYAVLGFGVLVFHTVTTGRERAAAVGGAAAVAAMIASDRALGPWLVEAVNGYVPNAAYQELELERLLNNPGIVIRAGLLQLQAGATLFGGLPVWMFSGLLALATTWLLVRHRPSRRWLALAGLLVLGEIALASLMIVRHPPVYDYYDHRIWYYPLPLQAMVAALLVAWVSTQAQRWTVRRTAMASVLLGGLVISNVVHWDDYRDAQLRSRWFPVVYLQTLALKESLSDGRPRLSLSPEYAVFFESCLKLSPALRARAARAQGRGL